MTRPVHFEIQSSDPQRTIRFYSQVFGWIFQEYTGGEYWLITTGEQGTPGINGGMSRREGPMPAKGTSPNAFVCTIDIANIDDVLNKVEKEGGEISHPKYAIPGVGWLFYFIDPEGNTVGAMQEDPNAA